ncbi:MAG: radical SAM protein, partial [Candidatus Aenigmarchaeota archaeon]|nr:radical SAM protein [Candidatus Aenigmarchaeota archaeon]
MKTLALNPPYLKNYSRQSRSPAITKGGTTYYPYFLAYMTSALEKAGFDVELVDAVARGWNRGQTIEYIGEYRPNLVVIDTSTPSIYNDIKVAEAIKKALPEAFIVLVGTHPSNLPNETLKLSKKVDAVVVGEYDYTVRDLAKVLKDKKSLKGVNGLVFREKEKIITNKPRERIKNLDELPFVSEVYKKHLNVRDYFYSSVRYPQVTILTARGCPYSCSFCNSPFKKSYRPRSIENVVEEFLWIQENLPEVKEVMIEDETFPAVKKRTMELCNLMIERGVKLKWSCNARVDTDIETLKKMKEAGCRLLCVGFESPEQKKLDDIQKRTTKEMQIEFMKNTREVGLLVNGCFILGLPGETKESMQKTIDFAKELSTDTAQFY